MALIPVRNCDVHIAEALELARHLTILADEGESDAQDDSCVLLYSVIRDCAYRIRKQAVAERDAHAARGFWDPAAHVAKETEHG